MKKSVSGARIRLIIGIAICLVGCIVGVAWWLFWGGKTDPLPLTKPVAALTTAPVPHGLPKPTAQQTVAPTPAPQRAQVLPPVPLSLVTDTTGKQPVSYVSNELLLKFHRTAPAGEIESFLQRHHLTVVASHANLAKIGYRKVRLPEGVDLKVVLDELRTDKAGAMLLARAEPNFIAKTLAADTVPVTDPLLPQQWYVQATKFDQAWQQRQNITPVTVAVLDTGVDAAHPDLAGQCLSGYNFVADSVNTLDDSGHGTHVAGIIGAKWNDIGIRGLCPFAKILPVKVLDNSGTGTYEHVAEGVIYAADQGARVLNLSFGGYAPSDVLQSTIAYAAEKKCILVAAAGNDGVEDPMYPAACQGVIAVGASDRDGKVWASSNKGKHISATAPGVDILSTEPGDNYAAHSGTSASAAIISALSASLLTEDPSLQPTPILAAISQVASTGIAPSTTSFDASGTKPTTVTAHLPLFCRGVSIQWWWDKTPEEKRREFVKNTWGLTSLTDGAIDGYLSNTTYNGVSFIGWVDALITIKSSYEAAAANDYAEYTKILADYGATTVLSELVKQTGYSSVFSVAKLASWPVEFGLNLFSNSVTEKGFRVQRALYYSLRDQNNTHNAIINCPEMGLSANLATLKMMAGISYQQWEWAANDETVPVFKNTEGWLYTEGILYPALTNMSPQDFYEYIGREYDFQEKQNAAQLDRNRLKTLFLQKNMPATSPQITVPPQDKTIEEGQTATLNVTATGTEPLRYTWYKDTDTACVVIPGATSSSLEVTEAGDYTVEVNNEAGYASSDPATVTVLLPASISVSISAPANGSTVHDQVTVNAIATGASKVEFYLDDQRIMTDIASPFSWSWNTITANDGTHALTAKAYDNATLLGTSSSVSVTVANASVYTDTDANEPNNSSTAATPLTYDVPVSGRVSSPTDVDWFKVEVTTPGTLTFDLVVPAGKDFDLELYGPDACYVKGSYRDVGMAEQITDDVTTVGTYYVRVYGYPAGNGSYSTTTSYTITAKMTMPATPASNFTYTISGGTITITSYTGTGGAVVIPSSIDGKTVTTISRKAFYNCTNLTSITISSSVTSIESLAFAFCTNLATIMVDGLNSAYRSVNGVLFNKNQTTLIQYPRGNTGSYYTIPATVTSIGSHAFRSCTSLTSVIIPAGITSIEDGAFYECSNLAGIIIPDGVTSIESQTFRLCTSLTSIIIPDDVTSIGAYAFADCDRLTSIIIPAGVSSMGEYAFAWDFSLTNVTIENGVTCIGDTAFWQCCRLTSVAIPASVASIGNGAFGYCNSLNTIMVDPLNSAYCSVDGALLNKSKTLFIQCPGGKTGNYPIIAGVTCIGDGAFTDCFRLTSISIPASVTSIEDDVFWQCTGLSNFILDPQNAVYGIIDGVLFNKSLTTIVAYPPKKSGNCYTIPDGVTSIGYAAFESCTLLTSITFPASITDIGASAFSYCTALTCVTIPDGVTSIGNGAFMDCTNLTTITIPASVTSIGGTTFFSDTKLVAAYFLGNAPSFGSNVFYNDKYVTVYYLSGTTGWSSTFGGRPTVMLSAPTITWENPDPIVYGTALDATQLNAHANVPGQFVYSPAAGSKLPTGTPNLTVTFTPTDTAHYMPAQKTVLLTVTKKMLTATAENKTRPISQANPTFSIIYVGFVNGDTAAVLDMPPMATCSATAMSGVGTYPIMVSGGSDNNYAFSYVAGTLTITKAPASVTLSSLAHTYDGTAKSATTVTDPIGLTVTVTYGGSTTVPTAVGNYTVVATVRDANYAGNATGKLVISKATPVLTWPPPAGIVYGAALGAAQLNATANVPGSFIYTPTEGAILNAGADHTLNVTFTPADTTNYNSASTSTGINIAKAVLTVTADNKTSIHNATNQKFTWTATEFVNGDTAAVLDTPPTVVCSATATSGVGTYPITVSGGSDNNYAFSYVAGTLTITSVAVPTVTTTAPAAIGTTNATSGGNVTNDGGTPVTARGVCWSTSTNPTVANTKTTDGAGTGVFASTLTGLSTGTTYYVRAYATNSVDTTYGELCLFTTACTVTFDAEGGTAEPTSKTVTFNVAYGILPLPTRIGHTFAGWWTGDGGTGSVVTADVTVSNAADHTLHAKWTANTYLVTYDAAGGTVSPATKNVTFNATYGTLATPTRTGYTFVGWWTGASGTGDQVTANTVIATAADHTLYAKWMGEQAITFSALPSPTYGDADFAPGATASSGLAVTYASDNLAVATIIDGKIHVVGAGATTITASQSGNDSWNAAPPVAKSLTVAQRALTATAKDKTRSFGAANPAFSIGYTGFANGDTMAVLDTPSTAVCSATATSGVGTYPITVSGGSDINYAFSYVDGTLTIIPALPTVTTTAPTTAGTTTAMAGGNVTDDGRLTITARGVCWSTSPNPTVANAKTTDGAATGVFTSTITGLSANTTYYVRAYATNSAGTGYGAPQSFTTPVAKGADFVVTSIIMTPTLPAVGGKITATITVKNQGILSGKAGYLYVWLNKPGAVAVGEPCDKSASLSTLKPGQTKIVKLTLTAPKTLGTFTLRAFVDAKNLTKEDDEYNNQETYVYDTGRPDFEILEVSISPETPTAGKTFTAYVTVTNSGDVAGDAGYLDLWADSSVLATKPVASSKTKGNKYKTVGILQPGQQKIITVTSLKAPVGTTWTLGVLIDSRAKTLELDETNNWFDLDYGAGDTPPLPPPPPG